MKNTYSLKKLESFAKLLHAVQKVKRVSRRPDETEMTSTAEHTFEVVMMSWYIASVHDLELDQEKIIKYALTHDIIEGYAGDTPIFDTNALKDKAEREAQALIRIEKEFPEFSSLIETIHEYEEQLTPEAKSSTLSINSSTL